MNAFDDCSENDKVDYGIEGEHLCAENFFIQYYICLSWVL